MNEAQRAAFLQAQAACAIVEAIALAVAALKPKDALDTPGYSSIINVIAKYGIGHNAALSYLGEN